MRIFSQPLVFGAVLAVAVSCNAVLAQDQGQPAANTTSPAASQAPSSDAQQPHAPDPTRQAKRLANQLSLSPDQQSKLEPILANRDQLIQNTRADSTLAPREKRATIQGIRQDSDVKIESLLTETQKQQYELMKPNRKAQNQQGGAPSTD